MNPPPPAAHHQAARPQTSLWNSVNMSGDDKSAQAQQVCKFQYADSKKENSSYKFQHFVKLYKLTLIFTRLLKTLAGHSCLNQAFSGIYHEL